MEEHQRDHFWKEGRNLKEERSKKARSKYFKEKKIQQGIDRYFSGKDDGDVFLDGYDQANKRNYH